LSRGMEVDTSDVKAAAPEVPNVMLLDDARGGGEVGIKNLRHDGGCLDGRPSRSAPACLSSWWCRRTVWACRERGVRCRALENEKEAGAGCRHDEELESRGWGRVPEASSFHS